MLNLPEKLNKRIEEDNRIGLSLTRKIILSKQAAEDFGIDHFVQGKPVYFKYNGKTIELIVNVYFKLYMFYV